MPPQKVHAIFKRSGRLKHRILAAHAVVGGVAARGGRGAREACRARACVLVRARRASRARAGVVSIAAAAGAACLPRNQVYGKEVAVICQNKNSIPLINCHSMHVIIVVWGR